MAASFFVPDTLDRDGNNSALVISHPAGAVEEEGANLYATKLDEQWFVTIATDLPTGRLSSGEPRNAAAPEQSAEAFSAAVDSLVQNFVRINRSRIGGVKICGSGSCIVSASKLDPRIAAYRQSAC